MKTVFRCIAICGSPTAAASKVLKEKDKPPAQLSACYAGGRSALTPNSHHPRARDGYLLWLASSGLMKLN